jgi:hypothetical protein
VLEPPEEEYWDWDNLTLGFSSDLAHWKESWKVTRVEISVTTHRGDAQANDDDDRVGWMLQQNLRLTAAAEEVLFLWPAGS